MFKSKTTRYLAAQKKFGEYGKEYARLKKEVESARSAFLDFARKNHRQLEEGKERIANEMVRNGVLNNRTSPTALFQTAEKNGHAIQNICGFRINEADAPPSQFEKKAGRFNMAFEDHTRGLLPVPFEGIAVAGGIFAAVMDFPLMGAAVAVISAGAYALRVNLRRIGRKNALEYISSGHAQDELAHVQELAGKAGEFFDKMAIEINGLPQLDEIINYRPPKSPVN